MIQFHKKLLLDTESAQSSEPDWLYYFMMQQLFYNEVCISPRFFKFHEEFYKPGDLVAGKLMNGASVGRSVAMVRSPWISWIVCFWCRGELWSLWMFLTSSLGWGLSIGTVLDWPSSDDSASCIKWSVWLQWCMTYSTYRADYYRIANTLMKPLTCWGLVTMLIWHLFSTCVISWLWLFTREVSAWYFLSSSL